MKIGKSLIFWLAAIVLLTAIANMTGQGTPARSSGSELPFSEFMNQAENNKIAEVTVSGPDVYGTYTDGSKFYTYTPYDPTMIETLRKNNVIVNAKPEDTSANTFWGIVISWFPMILLIGVWIFFMRQANAGNSKAMSFGKSRARLLENSKKVTFADVAGCDESKQELEEVIDFLKDPGKFQRLGGKIPKGVWLVGPPGTGKTLLAKAVAGEADVPFFSISGSDFVEMFVGVGASRVRDMFAQAKKNSPCLLFIDEIDAVGRHRGAGLGGGNDEREQTLNQLLAEMDGFDASKGILILAATNRPEVLDKALLRPGRFDRRIIVDKPDLKGRLETLKVHSKDVHMDETVDLDALALATAGLVGSDLANMINEAAINAVKNGRKFVNQSDLFEAFELVAVGGKEKKDRVMSDKERKIVSYHEVGHALVSALQKNTEPVQKITIVPRTMGALGYTLQTPEEEKYLETKDELLAKITTFMAGRAAEVLVFHSATSGAANDIENATKIARAMVTMYGMSDTFGMMCLATVENQYLDGRAGLICGEDTAGQIDKEVLSIINKSYEDAMQMLTENRDILDHISDYLYEKETITGKEFMKIFREMKGLPQEEDKESLMPDDTADEKKASQEPRVLSKENNEAKDDTSIAEDSQSKAAIVSDDMFEE